MMQLKTTRRRNLQLGASWFRTSLALAGVVLAMAGSLGAQDFDFGLRTDKEVYAPGDAVSVTVGLTTRAPGVQGWSYGVRHDPGVLTLEADGLTFENTDAQGVLVGGFETTALAEGDGVGFIQAVVLTFGGDAQIPTDQEFFSLAFVTYTLAADACGDAMDDLTTNLEFVDKKIGVPGSPPVDLNITVGGISAEFNIQDGQVNIQCQGPPPPPGLTIAFDQENNDLDANQADILDVRIMLSSTDGAADIQGWQYGVSLDPDAITATAGESGADAMAVNGGAGPDFVNYDLADTSSDGTVKGVTVGVVISTTAPATEFLPVGNGETKHIDTIKVRSTQALDADATTGLTFVESLGDFEGRDPIEVIFVIAGEAVTPDFTSTKTINLKGGIPPAPRFIRSDANNDARVDIADGIWILGMLFYAKEMTACMPAADSNADGSVNITDAMYIFQWRLQPGATPGNLFPAPPAPFPECGTADDANLENCAIGSHVCTAI